MSPHLHWGPCENQEEQLPVPCSTRAQASSHVSCGKAALKQDCTGFHVNTTESSHSAAPGLIGTPLVRQARPHQHPFGPTFGFSVMLRRSLVPNRYLTVLSTLQATLWRVAGRGAPVVLHNFHREGALGPFRLPLIKSLCTCKCG